jgi:hypothetical protein
MYFWGDFLEESRVEIRKATLVLHATVYISLFISPKNHTADRYPEYPMYCLQLRFEGGLVLVLNTSHFDRTKQDYPEQPMPLTAYLSILITRE